MNGRRVITLGDFLFNVEGENIELTSYLGKEERIELPLSCEGRSYNIAEAAFSSMDNLISVNIPNGVNVIGDNAFYRCSALANVTLGEDVRLIGKGAFMNCERLESIIIPDGVTRIGDYAFGGCRRVSSVTCNALRPPVIGRYAFYGVRCGVPLYVPAGSIDLYKEADHWGVRMRIKKSLP